MWSGCAALLAAFYYQVFRTQCFTRARGAATLSTATVRGLAQAQQLLEEHQRQGRPLLLRGYGFGFEGCWSADCLSERFGDLRIEGGYEATLDDYLESYFEGEEPKLKTSCFTGPRPACSLQNGSPFCTRPCLTNATLNFGLVADSDPPFEDVLEEDLHSIPLLLQRALPGDAWRARALTWLVPSSVGFAPGAAWVEAVLWLSPKGARTGLHQDDEPCSVLHQVLGRKKVLLLAPDAPVAAAERPHCLVEHGTRYSTLSAPELETLGGVEILLEPGDALYVPNGWWHSVEAMEASVSISGRGLSFCEGISFLPYWLALLLQQRLELPEIWSQELPRLLALAPLTLALPGLVRRCRR